MPESVKVSFYVTERIDEEVDELVQNGLFTTKTDVYQEALRRLLLEYTDVNEDRPQNGRN